MYGCGSPLGGPMYAEQVSKPSVSLHDRTSSEWSGYRY